MTGRNRLTISKTLSFAGTTFFNAILNIWVLEVFGSSKVLGNINGYIGVAAIICNLLGGAFADSRYLVRLLLWSDLIASLVCFYPGAMSGGTCLCGSYAVALCSMYSMIRWTATGESWGSRWLRPSTFRVSRCQLI